MNLSNTLQPHLASYPHRIETYSDWRTNVQELHAWKPFDSPESAIHAFDDLCNRYQRQRLVGIYRLVIANREISILETRTRTIHATA